MSRFLHNIYAERLFLLPQSWYLGTVKEVLNPSENVALHVAPHNIQFKFPLLPKSETSTPVIILLQLYFKQVLCEVVVVLLQVTVPLDHGGRTWGVTLPVVASTAATMRARPSSSKSPMSWCPVWNLQPPSTLLASNMAQVSEIDISIHILAHLKSLY